MAAIETLLARVGAPATPRAVVLRPHRSDDLGWVLARHAALYAKEHGWGSQFKLLVAGIIADFMRIRGFPFPGPGAARRFAPGPNR